MKKFGIVLLGTIFAITVLVNKATKSFEKTFNKTLGKQLVVEFFGCNRIILDDIEQIEKIMLDAALAAHATIVAHKFHQFSPQGVSGAVIVAESHLAIHTWPEYNYCHVDIFTCGEYTDNDAALEIIKQGIGADHYKVTKILTCTLDELAAETAI